MLRLLRLPVAIADMVYEAQAETMRKLHEGWDREAAEYAERHKQNEKRIAESLVHQALDASALEVYLNGLVGRAATGDDVVVSIPTSISVSVVGGPSIDALMAIVSDATHADDDARKTLYLPHPGDLAAMIRDAGVDPAWARRFDALAVKLEDGQQKITSSLTRMKAEGGQLMLGAMKEERQLIDAYGADRLFRLVTDPRSLTGNTQPPPRFGKVPDAALVAAMGAVRSK
jgi:hypothetical protein